MSQQFRTSSGGHIDRGRVISFTFDGKSYQGYEGDTLASALLANGVHLVGRSFKYHRPRGIQTAGSEEPNAIVELRSGPRKEPNTRATTIELFDGLVANSQNRWPSLSFDIMAINNLFSPLLSAGFYYKTFMWPASFWTNVYEHVIRRAAGLGTAATEPDPDHYEQCHEHCDVLVVGAGPAGLSAALAAAKTDARVIIVDEHPTLGGSLNRENFMIDGKHGSEWAAEAAAELAAMDNVHVFSRTTVFGYYDHNVIGAVEKVSDHLPVPPAGHPRQRMWLFYPRRVILATGATERPLVFGNNDKPGIMLASAARSYINAYGVKPGKRVIVATNNNDAYRTAIDLHRAGVFVTAVIDSRAHPEAPLADELKKLSIRLLTGSAVGAAEGGKRVKYAQIVTTQGDTLDPVRIDCDLIACSGGWNPNVHLHSQSGAKPVYDDSILSFVPGESRQAEVSAGAANGSFALQDCLDEGHAAGAEAAKMAGFKGKDGGAAKAEDEGVYALEALWIAPTPHNKSYKQFIDQQNDVKASDVELASQEGYDSVELLKRYTTQGMATDQGKTSNVNALAILACQRGEPIPQVGITTFRPPYVPVAMGVFAGHTVGNDFMPVRRTAIHDWNEKQGAVFIEAGLWLRARYFPQYPGDTLYDCYVRETEATRNNVALVDVTTLGKIDIQGPDAPEFLNRLYINNWLKLPIGKARYGIMLRDDGIVMDDGTTWRLSETDYFMTTTTAHAGKVMAWLEELLQTRWQELRVHVTSVSEQWAGSAVAGPQSRAVLKACVEDASVMDNEVLPFMGVIESSLKGGIPCRIARISFSGEMAYEAYVPSDYATAMMELLWTEAQQHDGCLYGLEALGAMRIEKGHVTGAELDGRVSIDDAGLGKMANPDKLYIGKAMRERPELLREDRPRLVGIKPVDRSQKFNAGAILCAAGKVSGLGEGWITAVTHSPALGHWIGLGFVAGGHQAWEGKTLVAADPVRKGNIDVEVVSPHMYDPQGERMHG